MTAPAEPRRWEVPPEPGPDVTVVRDCDGELWWRWLRPHGWRLSKLNGRLPSKAFPARSWHDVMEFAPLTDVTAEHPDYVPAEVSR